jgi:hypothetical protein
MDETAEKNLDLAMCDLKYELQPGIAPTIIAM